MVKSRISKAPRGGSGSSSSGTLAKRRSRSRAVARPRRPYTRRRKKRHIDFAEVLHDASVIISGAVLFFFAISLYLPLFVDHPQPVGRLGNEVSAALLYSLGWTAYLAPLAALALWGLVSFRDTVFPWVSSFSWTLLVLVFAFLYSGIFYGAGEGGRVVAEFMESLVGVFYPLLISAVLLVSLALLWGRSVVRPMTQAADIGARGAGSLFAYLARAVSLALSPPPMPVDELEQEVDENTEKWEKDAEELIDDPVSEFDGTAVEAGENNDLSVEEYVERDGDGLLSDDEIEFVIEKDTGQVGFKFKSDEPPFELPPLDLLDDAPETTSDKADLYKKAESIERTLADFKIDARVSHIQEGPRVTRFEISIGPGINVSKIHNIADNLALELAVSAVRIESPIPGKSAVGIEVPNKKFQLVTLKSILDSTEAKSARGITTVGLGRDIAGKPVIGNLAKMPHMLVSGATGSGKSVCLNTLIVSILFRASPDDLKFVLIDPKWVELSVYKNLPNLITPVVHTKSEIIGTLGWLIKEMERRYRLLQDHSAKNIAGFNAAAEREERMPYIIVIVDELADLFMIAGKVAEKQITRIAQKARAVGIHLVVATQRPDVKVITGTIKANIPSRIAFAVAQQVDSRTILDMNGAEKLLGEGDMLYSPIGAMKPYRVQGAYVSDEEIARVVEFITDQRSPEFNLDIQAMIRPEEEDELVAGIEAESVDELYNEAKQIVLGENRCSISYLQRRLRIGYQRSARIVDALVAANVVEEDPETGSYKVSV